MVASKQRTSKSEKKIFKKRKDFYLDSAHVAGRGGKNQACHI
jgi:hypothetical protein